MEILPELRSLLKVFSEACPAGAMRAGHMLSVLCRPWLEQVRSGLPLPKSLLTPGGYPLEFSFRSDSSDISYTAEPGLPQSPAGAKWQFVHDLDPELDPLLHPLLRRLVVEPSQRFGCWLSVRHRSEATAFKVYQEVTPQAGDLVLQHLRRDVPGLEAVSELEPRLLGIVSAPAGPAEYYCRLVYAGPEALHKLFAAAGVPEYLPAVINYLVYLAAEERSKLWNRLRIGISFSVSTAGPTSITLFAHGVQLFADNRQARTRVLGLARQLGAEMPVYERITSAFEKAEPAPMAHGLVGIKVGRSGKIGCAVGLRPLP